MIGTLLVLIGLAVAGVGAWVTAQAVILSDEDATAIATTMWGSNQRHKSNLLAQSRAARRGLIAIAVGTVFQIVGTALTLIP